MDMDHLLCSPQAEERASDPDHRGPFLDGKLKVVTHTHGKLVPVYTRVGFSEAISYLT
jgi:hypothetical protein